MFVRRKLGILFLVIGLVTLGIFVLFPKPKTPVKIFGSNPSPASTNISNTFSLEYQAKQYRVSWYGVDNIDSLSLIPNFSEKLPASSALGKYNCKFVSSAGFYTETNKPVGLFIHNGTTLESFKTNALFNGILSVNDFATSRITRDVPSDRLSIGLQTGPILIENSFARKLAIKNDKPARRVVAAVTGENKLFLLVIYTELGSFDGPYLNDLPEILKTAQKDIGQEFADAINLDGGSASAFYSPGVTLSELSPVGSFFCVR